MTERIRRVRTSNSRGAEATRLTPLLLTLSVAIVAALAVAVTAFGLASTYINLLTSGATVPRGDAVFVQGGIGAGTGQFDPFLTLSPGGSTPTEKGYNTTQASGEFDSFFGGGRTHPIRPSAIPSVVNPPGLPAGVYREFSLDANDSGADDFMSIDRIRIYLDNQNNLTGYNIVAETFSNQDATGYSKIYDMDTPDDAAVLMRSQTLTPGSGVSDITVLVKDSVFPAGCYYGAPTSSCNLWLYFYTESGFERTDPPDNLTGGTNADFNVTSGFEEWRTRLQPVVSVTKTANTSLDRKYDWTVQKLVSTDDTCTGGFLDANTAGDGLDIDLFNGQTDTVCWKIIADRGAAVDSNRQLTGTITITNPTGPGQVISDPIPATINSVSDVFDQGGGPTGATVVCPVTFPYTLAAGATLTCTYSSALGSSAAGSNTATANLTGGLSYSSPAVAFDPAAGTINVEDESATLDDDRKPSGFPQTFTDTDPGATPITYTEDLSCPATRTEHNTAVLTELDTNTPHSDPAYVNITCNTLSVSKNASPRFDRRFDWTVKKYVSSDETCPDGLAGYEDGTLNIDLFNGQSDTVCWKIVSDRGDAEDYNFAVTGTITITNDASIAANGVSVGDAIAGVGAATVDCDGTPGAPFTTTVNVPANSSATCTYASSLPDSTTRVNTATATLAGQGYQGTANIVFGTDPATIEDESASLADTRGPGFTNLSDDRVDTYTEELTCAEDAGTNSNTATLTELDTTTPHTDAAAVNLGCYGLTVEKSATPTYTRTFDWEVKKYVSTDETCAGGFVDDTLDISLNVGQSDTVCWKIEPDRLAGVDSGFAVTGTITITNNAPIAANGVSVSDAIAGFGAATVDCGSGATTVDIAASGSAQCTYSASLPDATDRNNTATATLAGTDYTGSTLIDFGAPTTVTDESATLDDDRGPNPPIPASYTDTDPNDTPVTYTEVLTCGDSRTESNTADLTETDTNTHRTDPAAVALECIPPSEGCTPGFWKTHPELWDGNSAVADVTTTIQTTDLFNATFGVTSGQSGLLDTRDLLYALDVSTATIDVSGLDSNLAALDRHAAAALVSADADGVDYAFTVAQVIAIYQDAVGAIAGPETISSALAKLQAENERGCPL